MLAGAKRPFGPDGRCTGFSVGLLAACARKVLLHEEAAAAVGGGGAAAKL
jgi:hypothetical protein